MSAVEQTAAAKQSKNATANRQSAKNLNPATATPRAVASSGVPLPPEELVESERDGGGQAGRRRKPRKLNRVPASQAQATTASSAGAQYTANLNSEIETLKNRIKDLEVQVEELYQKTTSNLPPKQPRRRGRGRGPPPPGLPEELVKLENELAASQQELEELRRRAGKSNVDKSSARPPRRPSAGDDYVEEIPRTTPPRAEDQTQQRQVTLTGNYRIPLPPTVSLDDVRSIQSGINSVNNVAKSLMDAHRSQRAAQSPPAKDKSRKGQSWSEWFGGYSMTVARLVNNIEADAAIEQSPVPESSHPSSGRPAPRHRQSAPEPRAAASKEASAPTRRATRVKSATQRATQRPASNVKGQPSGSGRTLSQQEVETLMA